jgi:hypothetical protein
LLVVASVPLLLLGLALRFLGLTLQMKGGEFVGSGPDFRLIFGDRQVVHAHEVVIDGFHTTLAGGVIAQFAFDAEELLQRLAMPGVAKIAYLQPRILLLLSLFYTRQPGDDGAASNTAFQCQGGFTGIALRLPLFDLIGAVPPQRFDEGVEARAIHGQPFATQIIARDDLALGLGIKVAHQLRGMLARPLVVGMRIAQRGLGCCGNNMGYTAHGFSFQTRKAV